MNLLIIFDLGGGDLCLNLIDEEATRKILDLPFENQLKYGDDIYKIISNNSKFDSNKHVLTKFFYKHSYLKM